MVTTIVKQAMAYGAPTGLSLDVLGAVAHASQDCRDEVVARSEPVRISDDSPPPPDLTAVAPRPRLDERPTEIGYVLHSSARPRLLPIDETDRLALSHDDIPGLQVVVDDALGSLDEADGQVVEASHHPGELREVDVLTGLGGHSWDPGHDLPTLVVDAERTWGPTDARYFEMAKDRLNQLSVIAGRAPGGVADPDRASHRHRVAQPALGGAMSPSDAHVSFDSTLGSRT